VDAAEHATAEGGDEQPDPSLWLALLSNSPKACAILIGASKQHRRTASKNLAPASLSKIGAAA